MRHVHALWLLAVLLVVAAPSTSAHADLASADPSSRSRLPTSPTNITLHFTQPINLENTTINVTGLEGARIETGTLRLGPDAKSVAAELIAPLSNGVYRVDWGAKSASDGHESEGSYGFAVGDLPTTNAREPSIRFQLPEFAGRALLAVSLSLAMAALAWGVGARAAGLGPVLDRLANAGAPLLLAATLVLLGAAWARSTASPSDWLVAAEIRGRVLAAFLALAGWLAITLPPLRAVAHRLLGVIATLLVVALSWSALGVAATFATAAHTLASAFLLALLALPILGAPFLAGASEALRRRWGSRVALAIALALLTGVFGWAAAARAAGVAVEASGLLAAKIAAVGFLVASVLVQLAPTGRPLAGRNRPSPFAVASLVLALVATGLGAAASAQVTHEDTIPPFSSYGEGDAFNVTIQIDPAPRLGAFSTVTATVVDRHGGAPETENSCGRTRGCLLLELVWPSQRTTEADDDPDHHHGGEHIVLEPRGDGSWEAKDVLFLEAGTHEVLIEIQTGYVFFDSVAFDVPVA